MLKKYIILAATIICNIQALPLKPDLYQSHKDFVNQQKAYLRLLNVQISNQTATASAILNGINVCKDTLKNLRLGSSSAKQTRPFLNYQINLIAKFKSIYPNLNLPVQQPGN